MALFIAKPIMWNIHGYARPSGVKVNSGFPQEHGFGHEEWNNSPALAFQDDGVRCRAFHTERVGNAPVGEEAGRTFVFMYASHDGVQDLVGVAGNATCLIDDEPQRTALAARLRLDRLGTQAWAVSAVKRRNGHDRSRFDDLWRSDLAWIPNWRCPEDTFLWLASPARLDPMAIRGTKKLLTMFGRHTDLDAGEAMKMIDSVPRAGRLAAWHRIRAGIEAAGADRLDKDLAALRRRSDIGPTTKQRLIDARIGQGQFRREVERLWGGGCAVSGCSLPEALRASHIVAWARSDDRERLDGENGLLLTADLDALFDRGLISFGDDGQMILSSRLGKSDRKLFRLKRSLKRPPTPGQRRYLRRHRSWWMLGS